MTHAITVTFVDEDDPTHSSYETQCDRGKECRHFEPCQHEIIDRDELTDAPIFGCHHNPGTEYAAEYEAHGETHTLTENIWMVDTGNCALDCTDSGRAGIEAIARDHGIGTHVVAVSYWGDGEWEVDYISTNVGDQDD